MPVPFQKSQTQYYPHMKPADVVIWERFIAENPSFYESVEYDVPVGSTPDFIKEATPEATEGARRLYSLKIDAVGIRGGQHDVIEIKPRATGAAVGQVKMYARLHAKEMPAGVVVQPVILTDFVSADVQEFAVAEGVVLLVA